MDIFLKTQESMHAFLMLKKYMYPLKWATWMSVVNYGVANLWPKGTPIDLANRNDLVHRNN